MRKGHAVPSAGSAPPRAPVRHGLPSAPGAPARRPVTPDHPPQGPDHRSGRQWVGRADGHQGACRRQSCRGGETHADRRTAPTAHPAQTAPIRPRRLRSATNPASRRQGPPAWRSAPSKAAKTHGSAVRPTDRPASGASAASGGAGRFDGVYLSCRGAVPMAWPYSHGGMVSRFNISSKLGLPLMTAN